MHSNNYVFYKIHAFNFLLAIYYSLRGKVFVYEFLLPHFLCRRFRQIDPEDYVDWDGWSEIREKASCPWSDMVKVLLNKEWKIIILGYVVDFSTISMEAIGKEFEKLYIMMELMKKSGGKTGYLIEPGLLRFLSDVIPRDCCNNKYTKRSNVNVKLDNMYEAVLSVLYFIRFFFTVIKLTLSVCRKVPTLNYDFFHSGINPADQHGSIDKLDFAWTVEQKVLSAENVLFFLPHKLTKKPRKHYKERKINYREPSEYFGDLRGKRAIGYLLEFFRSLRTLRVGILSSHYGQLIFRFACQSYLWCALAEHHKIKIYFTTQSAIWPERPEVAVFNAMGIRTITWSYSANYTHYRTRKLIGSDPQVALSAMASKEFFVWNKQSADWIKSRVLGEQKPEIKVIGPIMNGDSRICHKSPEEARDILAIEQRKGCVYVGIYDLAAASKKTRLKSCLGPSPFPVEMVDAFYEDIIKLSENNPQIDLVFKPKRSFQSKRIAHSRLVTDYCKNVRIKLFEYDINPYAPIASSDIGIAMPFSSPVLAGMHFGRLGLFHDPLNTVRSHMYHGMDMMISHDYNDLEAKFRFWTSNEGKQRFHHLMNKGAFNDFIGSTGIIDHTEQFRKAVFG